MHHLDRRYLTLAFKAARGVVALPMVLPANMCLEVSSFFDYQQIVLPDRPRLLPGLSRIEISALATSLLRAVSGLRVPSFPVVVAPRGVSQVLILP